jgi:hypothetical protein
MCTLLALEWLDGFYSYLALNALNQCLFNMNISGPKNKGLSEGPQNKKWQFSQNMA